MNLETIHMDMGKTLKIKVKKEDGGQEVLVGYLGRYLPRNVIPVIEEAENELQVSWKGYGSLVITHTKHDSIRQYDFQWEFVREQKTVLSDMFELQGAHWYGGAQVRQQFWPIERWRHRESAYVPGDSFKPEQWGGVQERYWVSSEGIAIYVEPDIPLFVSHNSLGDGKLIFTSKYLHPYKPPQDPKIFLKYTIFQGEDVRKVHDFASSKVIARPSDIPDTELFKYPIWSTWAMYKKNINEEVIQQYADDITKHGFKAAQIEIDDDWTPKYGDLIFDSKKFPDPKSMIDKLKDKGYRVTLWVHPFASPRSDAFYTGMGSQDFWVSAGKLPGVTTWWNGVGKALDVTNPDAVQWFKSSLKELQVTTGVTSFKFDAGEINWLPKWFKLHENGSNPGVYTQEYVKLAYEMDKDIRCQEVRVGLQTQNYPIFVRMMDKDSNWTYDNGLKTLIPHALTFGIIGYPFVLPDMIGGNAYPKTEYPEKELYIRWLEANVFMPSVQYSIPPWIYDEEVIEIAKKMNKLHEDHASLFIDLAKESTKTGAPINRPLWWIAPRDKVAQEIDTEFLVGNNLLVAPVVDKGARKRDIYLPKGQWMDEIKGDTLEGGKWYKDYSVALDELPYFTKLIENGED